MSLRERIPVDIKNALREKNTLELAVLRMLQSSIRNKEIEQNKKELTDEEVVAVISSEVKKRRDAAEEFEKVKRQDAAEKERAEIEILMKYMPRQMSEDEVRKEVIKAITEAGASGTKDFGSVMKIIMPAVKGKADGSMVNKMVRQELEKLEN